MKLHIHKAFRDGQLFHAYTRDKAGKLLKNFIQFGDRDEKILFSAGDWSYFRPAIFDAADPLPHEQKLKESIANAGIAIAHLKKFPAKIYVFDVKYDHTDARVYSLDEKLSDFHNFQNSISLSPKGDLFGCDEIEKTGEIDDKYYFEIEDLGIDLRQLTQRGFLVVFTYDVNAPEEYHRRRIQRALREKFPKKAEKLGIRIHDIRVDEFTIAREKPELEPDVLDQTPAKIVGNENNALPSVTVGKRYSASRLVRLFFISIVSIAGFIASMVAIMEYMEIKREDVLLLLGYNSESDNGKFTQKPGNAGREQRQMGRTGF